MGRTNGKKKKSKGQRSNTKRRTIENSIPVHSSGASLPYWPDGANFVASAGPGCHIAHGIGSGSDWVLEWESFDEDECDEDLPDLTVDPKDFTLTLHNMEPVDYKIAYISLYDIPVRGRDDRILASAYTTSSFGSDTGMTALRRCTTLIVLCPPATSCHLCYIPKNVIPADCIESDVQAWFPHPNPQDFHRRSISFPLRSSVSESTSFLCTQGVGGSLTHFLHGNLHAIDFACPEGTPILAVGNGVVVQVKTDCSHVTGIAVSNLFSWNSIMLQLDDDDMNNRNVVEKTNDDDSDVPLEQDGPLFVEYVHIATSMVTEGERVVDGQVIGTSGNVGFSPEPHLHLAAYRSAEPAAPTCGVQFHGVSGMYLPVAGLRYNAQGLVSPDG